MDLKESFSLPSGGKIYSKEVTADYTIRAPRLKDKGIGDLRSKRRVQAECLKKCLEPVPEVDPYDWHTSDYTAANLAQRMAARGKNMPLLIKCSCGHSEQIEVDLSQIKINKPKLPLDLEYETSTGDKIQLRFFTPRILDSIKTNIDKFKEEFPEATQDLGLQETCRAIIVSVNGQKLPYSQMTNYLLESYEVDLSNMIDKVFSTNFGPELMQTRDCSKCGKKLTFSVSPDNG
jgi:hypothetical protein